MVAGGFFCIAKLQTKLPSAALSVVAVDLIPVELLFKGG